jgi:GNAT superfamily N-acetyltransferase
MDDVSIRLLAAGDIPAITAAFRALGWHKPAAQYERYLAEQRCGKRTVLVSWQRTAFAGYVTVVWHSGYAPFREAGIPEIVDLNVLPRLRRRGIGSRLLDEAERLIAERSALAGIGVGLYADYGAAQRLYVERGYVPDGRGLLYHGRHVAWGDTVDIDDGLILYFTKDLRLEA